ncbi:MAG: DNA polymerase III subunit beta [Gammaproteobacteria bacterium]
MAITIQRETLLTPLQAVIGVVERRQTMPILSNVLLTIVNQRLSIVATDLEVELQAHAQLDTPVLNHIQITAPGRKLLDICRCLPEHTTLQLEIDAQANKLLLLAGRSRFSLATLPVGDFPLIAEDPDARVFTMTQQALRTLLQRTHFAMGQQDVRYYLNGMLLEVNEGVLRTVATDGHRLALNTITAPVIDNSMIQVILPRKGVLELMRLLEKEETEITVNIGSHHVRISAPSFTFTSKLIDARYPDYEKVVPKGGDKIISISADVLKQALQRAAILSNEKFRGVRLQLRNGVMKLFASNAEHEEAEEEIHLEYQGQDLDIGFNIGYLQDVLNTVNDEIKLIFTGPDSSILVQEDQPDVGSWFVVMPMRL